MDEEILDDEGSTKYYKEIELPYGTITPNVPEIFRLRKIDNESK